jgi:citronellol/citronellal dehydrogenase
MKVLAGRVALITGASRGIGLALAKRFAAEGASVVLGASRLGAHGTLPGTLEEAVDAIRGQGFKAAAMACDLADTAARADLIARASQHFGPVDSLVNNSAIKEERGA